MKRYAVIVRGLEAATDQEAADAVRALRANLRLPYSGVVTVEEWLFNDTLIGKLHPNGRPRRPVVLELPTLESVSPPAKGSEP